MDIEELAFEIGTSDPSLVSALMQHPHPRPGDDVEIGEQVRLRFEGRESSRQIDEAQVLFFVLSFPVGVTASMAAFWICKHLLEGRKCDKIGFSSINGQDVEDGEVVETVTVESVTTTITRISRVRSKKNESGN